MKTLMTRILALHILTLGVLQASNPKPCDEVDQPQVKAFCMQLTTGLGEKITTDLVDDKAMTIKNKELWKQLPKDVYNESRKILLGFYNDQLKIYPKSLDSQPMHGEGAGTYGDRRSHIQSIIAMILKELPIRD